MSVFGKIKNSEKFVHYDVLHGQVCYYIPVEGTHFIRSITKEEAYELVDRVSISYCYVEGSRFFEKGPTEDGLPITVQNHFLVAVLADGTRFTHNYTFRGYNYYGEEIDEEVWVCEYSREAQARNAASRIYDEGSIDLKYWTELELDDRTFEQKMNDEAIAEYQERCGYMRND